MVEFNADKTLDARGLSCPMPSVKTALELEQMSPGAVLEILTDDPVSKKDLPVWAESTGNVLLGINDDGNTIKIYIKKS